MLEEYERAAELAGRGTYVLSRLGVVYAEDGRSTDAYAILRELDQLSKRRDVSPFARAQIYAALGERDEAFAWLGARSTSAPRSSRSSVSACRRSTPTRASRACSRASV